MKLKFNLGDAFSKSLNIHSPLHQVRDCPHKYTSNRYLHNLIYGEMVVIMSLTVDYFLSTELLKASCCYLTFRRIQQNFYSKSLLISSLKPLKHILNVSEKLSVNHIHLTYDNIKSILNEELWILQLSDYVKESHASPLWKTVSITPESIITIP